MEYAQQLDGYNDNRLDFLPSIPFYFGRQDCLTSPDGNQIRTFPHGHAGWTDSFKWFKKFLGWTKREVIAALGAHTLGMTHERFSGFGSRKWVHHSFVLNNQYYMDIIAKKWDPQKVNCGSRFGCQWEWHTNYYKYDKTLMLNADMAIWNDIDPFLNRRTGEVTCNWKTCPLNPSTKDITMEYARENQIWLDDFAVIMERLLLTGYNRNELLGLHVPASVEYVSIPDKSNSCFWIILYTVSFQRIFVTEQVMTFFKLNYVSNV